ncbi:MAG: DUF6094 domain-containing protein [Hydrogeniiclostridium mannosilyticum]
MRASPSYDGRASDLHCPHYRLTADLCGIICDNFEQVRIHRFLDREFKQFKQVVVTGVRRRRTEAEQDAEALCSAAEHRNLYLPPTFCPRPAMSSRQSPKGGDIPGLCSMKTMARQLATSTGFDRLFAKAG